ncbi:MAG: RWP-RK domain-containing protein [Acidobacteriia bacterium]|nr:RWP-RK domain-containing protein [Terriglobia bacterium]
MSQTRTLTRNDLYERVWSTPMRKLASEFGVSDVGLAKICRKNGIPLPGMGYWRLVETGHAPERKSLPAIQPGESEAIAITAREPKPYDLPRKADLGLVPKVEVRDDREITHPLVVRTKRVFQPTSKDDRGAVVPKVVKAPHIRVSAGALQRALCILDALFCAVERQGYSMSWETSPDAKLKILVDGEEISFGIMELFSRKPHAPTPDEIARRKKNLYVYAPNWDYVPTGELRLSIEHLPYELRHIRSSWSDGKTRRGENCLGELVAILPHVAKALKLIREENERERLRREEERKQAEEERRRQEEYDRKAKAVGEFLRRWKESKAFRDLAAAIEEKAESSPVRDGQKQEILAIAQWIAQHADNMNPLADFGWMIDEFNDPPWQYSW